jgi:hypothetical protein
LNPYISIRTGCAKDNPEKVCEKKSIPDKYNSLKVAVTDWTVPCATKQHRIVMNRIFRVGKIQQSLHFYLK